MSLPKLLTACFFLLVCANLSAQADSTAKRLSVFLDCNGAYCDENFIRTEIKAIDFLSIRDAADVHLLITAVGTGGGTAQYQLIFYGQNGFRSLPDTLVFTTAVNATAAENRVQLTQYIKLGLVPFLARTPYATALAIDLKNERPGSASPAKATNDPWNYFVINLNAEGAVSADQNYTNQRGTASLVVSRTTDKSRFQLGAYGSRYVYTYKVADASGSTKYEVRNSDYTLYHFLVKALSQHWSLGYSGSLANNTFQNQRARFTFNPVVELNLFKYADINNRSFMVRYGADVNRFVYYDTTLYNKVNETLFGQEASLSVNFNQKWGSFSTGAYYRNYLKDPALYSTGANVNVNIRVVGGLSFYVSAYGNIIHDQVYLKKGKATEQEILTRRRQLESSFDYYTSFGISFRFGSKLNNFVNQRISGYRGF